jgi:sentrin-specific protease 8
MSTTNQDDDDTLLLNYHDAVIYQRDLRLVVEDEWLNDSIMHFYLEYLQQRELASSNDLNVLGIDYFMDPSVVSFFMQQCVDQKDIEEFVAAAPFPKENGRIFIAVNDQMSPSADWMNDETPSNSARGMHWSLLLITVRSSSAKVVEAYHFDSHGDSNFAVASEIARKIGMHVYQTPPSKPMVVHACKTPQQVNGYDCGIHVLAAAKILSQMNHGNGIQEFEEQLHQCIAVENQNNLGPAFRREISSLIAKMVSQRLSQQKHRRTTPQEKTLRK